MSRFWFGLAFLLASCASPRIGEVGPTACSNHQDDDHDGLPDCADPDCQNLDRCRVGSNATDAGTKADAGSHRRDSGVVLPPPLVDGSKPPLNVDEDSGMSVDDDGGQSTSDASTPPPTCKPACLATEQCIDLVCTPVTASTSQTIAVTIQSASAPNDVFTACLDLDCAPGFAICCPIDPYVRVVQVHADGSPDTVIGQTATVQDKKTFRIDYSGAPTWNVNLAEGDLLSFELWDDNTDVDDRLIFECKPVLTNFMSGTQTCNSIVGATFTSITADLQAK